ncbi:hypothetical protein AVEN_84657-1 [Araneus ventricosus]|uniref:Uncharacterized protein n=1 Tax=Araneus ventricosus TaxID=182803 RepID=A0A4Y2HL29_ARAVE|nr:hypothetical protein AVEN_84657-1 [Araneus ventricosus]
MSFLEQHVYPVRGAMVGCCLWMTTPVLTIASIVDECLQSEISPMYGLATILTGLESNRACGICLADEFAARQPLPPCLPELRRALLDEWCNILDQIDNLTFSRDNH